MSISIVRKTFKLDDEIILDDGTILLIQKRQKNSITGKSAGGFHLVIKRDGEIGKITVVRPHQIKTEEEPNGNKWDSDCFRH